MSRACHRPIVSDTLDAFITECKFSLFEREGEKDCDIRRILPEDVRAMALANATRYTEEPIYKAVKNGRFQSIKTHPASCDYLLNKKNKKSRKRKIEQKTPIAWNPPGRELEKKTCGHVVRDGISVCLRGHSFNATLMHCWRFACPKCFMDTAMRKAKEMDNRLTVYEELYPQDVEGLDLLHITMSPPQQFAKDVIGSKEGYDLLCRQSLDIIKSRGVTSGVFIFHPWRQDGEDGSENAILTGNTGDSLNWRLAPHFHIVGYGDPIRLKEVSKTIHRETGWVVKVIQSETKDRYPLLKYLLTHVGVGTPENPEKNNLRCIRLFGGISKKSIKIFETKERTPEECPHCDGYQYPHPKCLFENGEECVPPSTVNRTTTFYCKRGNTREIKELLKDCERESLDPVPQLMAMACEENPKITFIVSDPNKRRREDVQRKKESENKKRNFHRERLKKRLSRKEGRHG